MQSQGCVPVPSTVPPPTDSGSDGPGGSAAAPPRFERWERVARGPAGPGGRAAAAGWAQPKGYRRALEKALRCYDADPSRLLDCCRRVEREGGTDGQVKGRQAYTQRT